MNRRKFLKIVCFGTVGAVCLPIFRESLPEWVVPTYEPYIIKPDGPGSGRWISQEDLEFVEYRKIQIKEIIKIYKIPKSILLR